MLGSNQRPLPCEGSEAVSYAFQPLRDSPDLSLILSTVVNNFSVVFIYVLTGLLHNPWVKNRPKDPFNE